jgi:hypothetical protein
MIPLLSITGREGVQLKFPLEDGDEIFRIPANREDDYYFTFEIAFRQR